VGPALDTSYMQTLHAVNDCFYGVVLSISNWAGVDDKYLSAGAKTN